MNKIPLLNELMNYHKEKNLILSMPGNKCGKAFQKDKIGKEFAKMMGYMDITEVEPLDNLHAPEGVIKEAHKLLADYYGAKKAYFVVNGSTCSNLIAMFSAFNEGDEVVIERNCHKSIYNGLILRKLKVTYIEGLIDDELNIFLPPSRECIEKALEKANNPKGVILTYPSYYGIANNEFEDILLDLKSRGLKLVVDSAHGAHFGVTEKLPINIANIADYTIISAHKTIPALTQGSYLLVNEESEIDFYFHSFVTTSPSYLIMASLDYARFYLEEYGKEDYDKLIERAEKWREKINELKKVNIIGDSDIKDGYSVDKSRYVMMVSKEYSGHRLLKYLREKKIQCEMSFQMGVILILSPFNTEGEFKMIYKAIESLDMNVIKSKGGQANYYSVIPEKVLEPYEVFSMESTLIDIKDSKGKIAKENIIPYPPGIPVVCPGEIITEEAVNIILSYIENKKDVIGVKNGKIKVPAKYKS